MYLSGLKRISCALAAAALAAGCRHGSAQSAPGAPQGEGFDSSRAISVISREDGSGTREAFSRLFGIERTGLSGKTADLTTEEAAVTNSASVMMISVAGDPYAVGYLSFGTLSGLVRAVDIDGAAPTAENVKNGSYKPCRPFIAAVGGGPSAAAADFAGFIMSEEGQRIVEQNGFIAVRPARYDGKKPAGRVTAAGSSSVAPLMEKLGEAYLRVNPNAEVVVQQSDSSSGINAVADGVCDIAMVSRQLKPSELEKGITPTVIALDGIAVVVNRQNPLKGLTSGQVRRIYTGEAARWEQLI